jgi:hypothetical protein
MSQTSPRPVVPSSNEGLVIPTSGETEIPPRVSEDTHGPPLTANQGVSTTAGTVCIRNAKASKKNQLGL